MPNLLKREISPQAVAVCIAVFAIALVAAAVVAFRGLFPSQAVHTGDYRVLPSHAAPQIGKGS